MTNPLTSQPSTHNNNAISAALQSFQLPSIHVGVPRIALYSKQFQDISVFALALFEAGIIDPNDIQDEATTAHEIIEAGLGAWLDRRTNDLKVLKFSMHLLDANSMNGFYESLDNNENCYVTGYGLQIMGSSSECRTLEKPAFKLESAKKGLFKIALDAVVRASYLSIEIIHPYEMLDNFAREWEDDGLAIPQDEDVRDLLIDRYGDSAEVDEYLPSAIVSMLGGDLCLPICRPKNEKLLNQRQLRNFASRTRDGESAAVATQTALLLDAIEQAKAVNAFLPDYGNAYAMCIERCCCLMYTADDRVFEMLDEVTEQAYQCGEATECIGLAELPTNPEDLRHYFFKLDLSFNVLRHMDTLISMISEKI